MPESPCDARSAGAILTGPSAPGRSRVSPRTVGSSGTWSVGRPSRRPSESVRRPVLATPLGCLDPATHPSHVHPSDRDFIDRYGRQAGLARRPRRAAGLAIAGQLRDVAARHAAGRRRRPALPDRRPERLRQGLAREPLPVPDQPDPRPDRRLQRPGRVHDRPGTSGRGRRRGRGPPDRRCRPRRSASSPAASAARASSANLNPRYTFANFIVGSANRLAHAA